jgi:hypothetical protein
LSLEGIPAAVLGSAIGYSAWLPQVLNIIESHRTALLALPMAIWHRPVGPFVGGQFSPRNIRFDEAA